ncbi:protein FANTASTIC FOUR 3 [Cajanus cajan]|uniref:FAF domain-containing protein n=1 Tax=Cajanus cajan TaxID=3821 RepID=A0A151U701_CAJCA|nr:protein FANTASTIC FOUR 3 [Cajanus cajan]KYP75057.1 hypothetical protein KK1_007754 [Cajanus cajan]
MTTIVCHESRALKLWLPSSKPTPPQFIDLAFKSCLWDSNQATTKPHIEENKPTPSTWSFIEALSNCAKEPSQNQTTYVHSQQKRSSPLLGPKSLELCTENLGNETGTDIAQNSIENDILSSVTREQEQIQPRQFSTPKKAKTQNFPPPLTTIRGSESLRVRPHREDGRLVIEVTKVPPSVSCFQAQRSHGRLRLCFLTNPNFDSREEDDDFDENEPLSNESELTEQIKEDEETGEEQEEEECVACGCEESNNFYMPRRCKESGEHENNEYLLLNWGDSLCVATS